MAPKKRVTKKQANTEAEAKLEDLDESVVKHEETTRPTDVPYHKDPVILQLPIAPSRLEEIMENTNMHGILEYNPTIVDPQPYIPDDAFHSNHDTVSCNNESSESHDTTTVTCPSKDAHGVNSKHHEDAICNAPQPPHGSICYWCCHAIPHIEYGMPIRYDVFHKSFTLFGSFCSLECAAAYNFTTHMGSDRVWEIHSWIQMLAHRYGFADHIRPAPSRYLLKMFNGPMSIEEFRCAHKGLARTYLMNIPPFIHIVSQMEVLNTSFLEPTGHFPSSGDAKKLKRVSKVASQPKTSSVFSTSEAAA